MPVNETLATYSDMSFATAVAIYVLAMLLYFAEFAYGPQRLAKEREREQARVGQTSKVTAGGGSAESGGPTIGHVPTPQSRPMSQRLGGMAVAVNVLGVLIHLASLAFRGLSVHRAPWGNMYEFGSSICFAASVVWMVVLLRQLYVQHRAQTSKQSSSSQRLAQRRAVEPARLRGLGGFVMLPITILLFLSGTLLYANAEPLQPALQSYWIWIHVAAAIISTGTLIFAGVASVLFLLRARHENNPLKMVRFGSRLPTSQALDRMAYRATVFIMPVWTFAIVAGAIWAESAWGRFWGWDPKETCAFIAWVVYAAYLHARATAGWRGWRAAWINIFGLAVMIFNLFFINIVITGLHSYAGL